MNRTLRLAALFAIVLGLTLATAGCGPSAVPAPIVTTTSMITDLVENICGGRMPVKGLMGPGVDPHTYEPAESDSEALRSARIIFYNGLHLEGKMSEVFEEVGRTRPAFAVTRTLHPERDLRTADGFEDAHDPHVWFDVRLWIKAAESVRDALCEVDPAGAKVYTVNAQDYIAQLEELDRHVRKKAAELPAEKRVLVTAHDAFYYFGRAYGFEVRGLQGVSTASEVSEAEVNALASFLWKRQIPALFVESSVRKENLEAVQERVARLSGGKFRVKVGGELYSDALGTPGTPTGTYIGMVTHNIDTLVEALKP